MRFFRDVDTIYEHMLMNLYFKEICSRLWDNQHWAHEKFSCDDWFKSSATDRTL